MNAGSAALNNIGRSERVEAAKPQARRFRFWVAELPWLYNLVGATNLRRENAYGILHGYLWYRGGEEGANKGDGFLLFGFTSRKPPRAT